MTFLCTPALYLVCGQSGISVKYIVTIKKIKIGAQSKFVENVYTVISSGRQTNDGWISRADVCIFKWNYFPAAVRGRWKINVSRLFIRSIYFLLHSSCTWMFYYLHSKLTQVISSITRFFFTNLTFNYFLKSCHYSQYSILCFPKM